MNKRISRYLKLGLLSAVLAVASIGVIGPASAAGSISYGHHGLSFNYGHSYLGHKYNRYRRHRYGRHHYRRGYYRNNHRRHNGYSYGYRRYRH